jgi:hypothetical protein
MHTSLPTPRRPQTPHPQCLPRPERALASADGDGMQVDAPDGAGLPGSDLSGLLPDPKPVDAERLGTELDIQYLGGKLRDVCIAVDELGPQVKEVLTAGGGGGGGAGDVVGLAGGGGGGGGAGQFFAAVDSLELLNRQIKAYLAVL